MVTTQQIVDELQHIASAKQEQMICLTLDLNDDIIEQHLVFKGTLTGLMIHPREVFAPAVVDSAAGIIIIHNHPSGNPAPSGEDIETTEQLYLAGRILGIRVHDHIILGKNKHYSFAADGLLDRFEKQVRESKLCTV